MQYGIFMLFRGQSETSDTAIIVNGKLLYIPVMSKALSLLGELIGQGRVPGQTQEGGTGTTDAESLAAQGLSHLAKLIALVNQGEAVGLVEAVIKAPGNKLLIPKLQGLGQNGKAGQLGNCILERDSLGQHRAGSMGTQGEIR
jgi:hypothetical protein